MDNNTDIEINSPDYWELAYLQDKPNFDKGKVIPAIERYFGNSTNNLTNTSKDSKILIPGAGNAYEAEFLHTQGYTNVYVVDFALTPLENLKKRVPDFPLNHVIQANFFTLMKTHSDFKDSFDCVIEKAFFCAITPDLRQKYVETMYQLIKPQGILFGLFTIGKNEANQAYIGYPPFSCSLAEYKTLFLKTFDIHIFSSKDTNALIKMVRR